MRSFVAGFVAFTLTACDPAAVVGLGPERRDAGESGIAIDARDPSGEARADASAADATSSPSAETWEELGPPIDTDGPPSLAVALDGTPFVAFVVDDAIAVVRLNGDRWEDVGGEDGIGASLEPAHYAAVSLSLDPLDSPVVAFVQFSTDGSEQRIGTRVFRDGQWLSPEGVPSAPESGSPDVSAAFGTTLVTFTARIGDDVRRAHIMKLSGLTWTPLRAIGGSAIGPMGAVESARFAGMAADSEPVLALLVDHFGRSSDVVLGRVEPSGRWVSFGGAPNQHRGGVSSAAAAIGGDRVPLVVMDIDQSLWVSSFEDGAWVPPASARFPEGKLGAPDSDNPVATTLASGGTVVVWVHEGGVRAVHHDRADWKDLISNADTALQWSTWRGLDLASAGDRPVLAFRDHTSRIRVRRLKAALP